MLWQVMVVWEHVDPKHGQISSKIGSSVFFGNTGVYILLGFMCITSYINSVVIEGRRKNQV